MYNMNITKIM